MLGVVKIVIYYQHTEAELSLLLKFLVLNYCKLVRVFKSGDQNPLGCPRAARVR